MPAEENEAGAEKCVGAAPGSFPTKSGAEATRCFWNQKREEEYLKYGRFVTSARTVTAASDVLSDAVGPIRLILSTAIASTTDDADTAQEGEASPTQDRSLNLLAANGGNLSVTGAFPIYYTDFGGSSGQMLWNSYARLGGNFQSFGGDTGTDGAASTGWKDFNGNVELVPLEFHADLLSAERKFNLLAYAKTSAVFGTRKFSEAIGNHNRNGFFLGQLGGGIRLADLVTVYLTWNWYSDNDIPGGGGLVTIAVGR